MLTNCCGVPNHERSLNSTAILRAGTVWNEWLHCALPGAVIKEETHLTSCRSMWRQRLSLDSAAGPGTKPRWNWKTTTPILPARTSGSIAS